MAHFFLELAGRVVSVHSLFDDCFTYCAKYLSSGDPVFSLYLSGDDIEHERKVAVLEDVAEGKAIRQMSDAQLEITALQRKIAEKMFDYDTLVFHGSVVAVDGEAYLFTAKSGTGKSTHTALWRQVFGDRAVMVNDDKPFLHVGAEGVTAYGSPWNGKHGLGTNTSAPLKGICILERGVQNEIREIPASEAVFMLLQQSNRPMNSTKMPIYMNLLDGIAKRVRFFRLKCNMDPEAARIAYEAMSGKLTENERETYYED